MKALLLNLSQCFFPQWRRCENEAERGLRYIIGQATHKADTHNNSTAGPLLLQTKGKSAFTVVEIGPIKNDPPVFRLRYLVLHSTTSGIPSRHLVDRSLSYETPTFPVAFVPLDSEIFASFATRNLEPFLHTTLPPPPASVPHTSFDYQRQIYSVPR